MSPLKNHSCRLFFTDHKMNFPDELNQQLGMPSPDETRDRRPYEGGGRSTPLFIPAGVGISDPSLPIVAPRCIAILRAF